jgi:hypothetical protein
LAVAEELVVLVVGRRTAADLGEVADESFDPLDSFEADSGLVAQPRAQPQRCAVPEGIAFAVHALVEHARGRLLVCSTGVRVVVDAGVGFIAEE